MPNRLASETSPYLLQHRDNPVDWYPWGDDAFEAAAREDKPIFLSIGYAACHWCHVMAHECFENEDIASVMNELFVNIKVDREELPDVDTVYMNAIHVTGEGGGWPLSAFCDSSGKPYYLGTYFPPVDRHGRPGFPTVLRTMHKVYREQRDRVDGNAEAVLDGLRQIDEHHRRGAVVADVGAVSEQLIIAGGRWLAQRSDATNGGLGAKPKFPSSSAHELLGRASRRSFGDPARDAFLLQAERMAAGGIYDHLGGGFARYSVDEAWLVPHFEKMLYDNGQLLAIYGDAYAMTGDERYAEVILETVAWLQREMQDPAGGLYASLDADSEGEEGRFYVWDPEAVESAVGGARAILLCSAYGITDTGNFEGGMTVLSRVGERGSAADEAALAEARAALLAAREERERPGTDTKVLAGWNGLALSGLVCAWEATGFDQALALARSIADFLVGSMLAGEGRLWRVYKDGATKLDGTVDDYAFVSWGLMRLAEATGEESYWRRAEALLDAVVDRFYEERDGVGIFYMTPVDGDIQLIHRPESHGDGAIPSGAAVAVQALLRRALLTGHERSFAVAERYLAGRAAGAREQPFMFARLLCAVDDYLAATTLVVSEGTGKDTLLEAARRAFAPTLAVAPPWAHADLLAGKEPGPAGEARAFLCRGQTCSEPIATPEALKIALAGKRLPVIA